MGWTATAADDPVAHMSISQTVTDPANATFPASGGPVAPPTAREARPSYAEIRYPPLEESRRSINGRLAARRRARLTPARFRTRASRDPQLLLAVAIAVPVVAMEAMWTQSVRPTALVASLLFVGIQLVLTALPSGPRWLPVARLGLSLGFVALANVAIDSTGTWPLNALNVPIVALASSFGGPAATAVAALGVIVTLLPVGLASEDYEVRQAALAIAVAAVVVGIGGRNVVLVLQRSAERLRRANARDHRRARQLGAVEAVGSVLAREGSTTDAFERVMELLEHTFGYRYPSVYLWDGEMLRLAAQRNYRFPIFELPGDVGVIGRVVHSLKPEFLRDARDDPAFQSGDPDIVGEIAVPLVGEGELFGVLNVETGAERPLDDDDFATMLIVGDRLAAALALGRERQKLTERSELLDRLITFEATLNTSLEPAALHAQITVGAATVIPADMLALILRDPSNNEYRTIALAGGDERVIGARILPGEGISGRAIASRDVVVDDHLERASFPRSASAARIADVVAAMGVPLIHDDEVVGAMSFLREDTSRPYTAQEREVAALMASRVALALANVDLHHAAKEAAITDALTGLHNRRHFDAAIAHADALRDRLTIGDRRERSAILFDLDHFGSINKRHGHQVGDQILRDFADVVRSRVRRSDLAARYGGEEFVVVLDGASREEAVRLADEIRIAFRQRSIDTADSGRPITTVSAGCAALERSETSGSVLLDRADVGLAMAKAAGRDQVVAA